jgi:tetratricopeptide (TPR) repeat protein
MAMQIEPAINDRRSVRIFSGDGAEYGLGYWLGGDVVLTSGSACPSGGAAITVTFVDESDRDADRTPATIVWAGADLDLALLRISDTPAGDRGAAPRFGRFTGGLDWTAATVLADRPVPVEVNPLNRRRPYAWDLRTGSTGGWPLGAVLVAGGLLTAVIGSADRAMQMDERPGLPSGPPPQPWPPPPPRAALDPAATVAVPLAAAAADQAFRTLVEAATGQRLRLDPVELAESLQSWLPGGPAVTAADLLDPVRAVEPFAERAEELGRLFRWCTRGSTLEGLLLTGPAGAGKTRLARQLGERLEDSGWIVGELATGPVTPRWLRQLSRVDHPVLVLADRADEDQRSIGAIAAYLVDHPPRHRVRLLLLARDAGSWWPRLRARRSEAGLVFAPAPLRLGARPVHPTDPRVVGGFATALGLSIDPVALERYADLAAPGDLTALAAVLAIGQPLATGTAAVPGSGPTAPDVPAGVHVSAGVQDHDPTARIYRSQAETSAGDGTGVVPEPPVDPVDALLAAAERDWAASARQYLGGRDPVSAAALGAWREAVLIALVCVPRDRSAAVDLLGHLPTLGDPGAAAGLAEWLHQLHPSRDPGAYWAAPLADPLRERYLRTHPAPATLLAVVPATEPASAQVGLATLARAAVGSPDLVALLRNLVADHVEALGVPAIDAVGWIETPGPLLAAIALVTGADALPRHVCAAMVRSLPVPAGVLAEIGVQLRRRLVRGLEADLTERSRSATPELGRQLTHLSGALAEAGRPAEGLEVARRAVEVQRRVTTTDPALAAVPGLLAAVRAQSDRHAELNQTAAAADLAAAEVRHCRELTVEPVTAAYAGWLADALVHLAQRLPVERDTEAVAALEESVVRYRQAGGAQQWPALADTLRVLSDRLSAAGRRAQAAAVMGECVRVHEELAGKTPAVRIAGLGAAQLALAERVWQCGDLPAALQAAERAVATFRRMSWPGQRPDGLARALVRYSDLLAAAGRRWEAVAAGQEGVAAAREAVGRTGEVDRRPAAGADLARAELVRALTAMMLRWDDVDRRDRAAEVAAELVDLHRRLWTVARGAVDPDLAAALVNLAARHGAAGGLDQALREVNEAIAILRAEPGDEHAVGLAAALNNRAIILGEIGGEQVLVRALADARVAVELLTGQPDESAAVDRARALSTLSLRLAAIGDANGSATAAEQAVVLLRARYEAADEFAGTRAATAYAMALSNLAQRWVDAGGYELAAAVAVECREVIHRAQAGGADLDADAAAMAMLVADLRAGVTTVEAVAAAREAVTAYRTLAAVDPVEYVEPSARALETLARLLELTGHVHEAITATREAVNVRENLARDGSAPALAAFAAVLGSLSRLCHAVPGPEPDGTERAELAVAAARRAHELSSRIRDRRTLLVTGSAAAHWLSILLAEVPLRELASGSQLAEEPARDLAESLMTANVAITWYRELLTGETGRYEVELARALHHRSRLQTVVGNFDIAVASAREAAKLLRPLCPARPELRVQLAQILTELGDLTAPTDPALAAAQIAIYRQAVLLYESLAGEDPQLFEPSLHVVLGRLVRALKDGGRRNRREYDRRNAQLTVVQLRAREESTVD